MMNGYEAGPAEHLYQTLEADREAFLTRARHAAVYTLPFICPDAGTTPAQRANETHLDPYQSLGARGVNTLASKLGLVLLPPSGKFFRYVPAEEVMATADPAVQLEIEQALSLRESAMMRIIEKTGIRKHSYEALRHLIVTGNAVVRLNSGKRKSRLYGLDAFVVRRGNARVLDLVMVESIEESEVPDDIVKVERSPEDKNTDKYDLYTHVYWDDKAKRYREYQEILGQKVEGSEGSYAEKALPYLILRWTRQDGENYGRGYVDEMIGDLRTFETLTTNMTENAAIAAFNVWLASPSSLLRPSDLANARNGDVLTGNADDVQPLAKTNFTDLRTVFEVYQETKSRLEQDFMLGTSVQRQAERVTAEEIRAMLRELETTLGGIYSLLADEFQKTLVDLVENITPDSELPKLPEGDVALTIITGIEALGRAADIDRLDQFLARMQNTFGPEALIKYVNPSQVASAYAASLGLDRERIVYSEQQVAEMEQQAQMAQMAQQVAPDVVKAGAQAAQQGPATP